MTSRRGSRSPGAPRKSFTAGNYSKAAPRQASNTATAPQGGSAFKNVAATAAGVAAGTAVGHVVGAGVTGMLSHSESNLGKQGVIAHERPPEDPCTAEIMQLLQCAQQQDEISFCQAASEAFKKCLKNSENPTNL